MTRRYNQSRYTADEKLAVVLRQIKGETWDELHEDLGISISEMQRWKQVAVEAMRKRLELPSKSRAILTEFRTLLQKISEETDGWKPSI